MKKLLIFFVLLYFFCCIELHPISLESNQEKITVEVKGELENPGLYTLDSPATVNDLLQNLKLTEASSIDHLSLQKVLLDQSVIIIRTKTVNHLVSINAATIEELCTLPGIGEIMAKRIIDYRELFGGFTSLEELMEIKGIGKSRFEALKDMIVL